MLSTERKAISLDNSPQIPRGPLFSSIRKRFSYGIFDTRSPVSTAASETKRRKQRIVRLSTQLDEIKLSASLICSFIQSVSPNRRELRTASLTAPKTRKMKGTELIRDEIVEEYKHQQSRALGMLKTTMPRRFLTPRQQIRLFGNIR
mmetsp:Transcript_9231/g.17556  ORF Transcript_9231/g.17556 Transcript_9231/m.17556 type:complete len:147 (+) Transcript_9231:1494-1934(+)